MNTYNSFSVSLRAKSAKWQDEMYAKGLIQKPTKCCICGQTKGHFDAHAEDYTEPFEIGKTDRFHLCYICHMVVHCRFGHKGGTRSYDPRLDKSRTELWNVYLVALDYKICFEPFYRPNWNLFFEECLKGLFKKRKCFKVEENDPQLMREIGEGRYINQSTSSNVFHKEATGSLF